jgi:predicted MFS family arabinose efflux permease
MSHYFSVSYYASYFEIRGRKRACVTYCITYIASCITKHSPQYRVLMLGRILGGIATSLLFSAFESWLVAEHFKVRKFYLFLKLSAVY